MICFTNIEVRDVLYPCLALPLKENATAYPCVSIYILFLKLLSRYFSKLLQVCSLIPRLCSCMCNNNVVTFDPANFRLLHLCMCGQRSHNCYAARG